MPWRGCRSQFENGFERARESYRNLLALAMVRRRLFVTGFLAVVLVSFLLVPFLGSNFFPTVDAGQISCMPACRSAPASRIRCRHLARVEDDIRRDHSARRAGIPSLTISACRDSAINLIYNNSGGIGSRTATSSSA